MREKCEVVSLVHVNICNIQAQRFLNVDNNPVSNLTLLTNGLNIATYVIIWQCNNMYTLNYPCSAVILC